MITVTPSPMCCSFLLRSTITYNYRRISRSSELSRLLTIFLSVYILFGECGSCSRSKFGWCEGVRIPRQFLGPESASIRCELPCKITGMTVKQDRRLWKTLEKSHNIQRRVIHFLAKKAIVTLFC
jgi:hypothetical protein